MAETLVDCTDTKPKSIGEKMDSFMMRGSIEGGVGLDTGITPLLPDPNDGNRLKAIDSRDLTCDALFRDENGNLFHVSKAIIKDSVTGLPKLIYAIRQLNVGVAIKQKRFSTKIVVIKRYEKSFNEVVINPTTNIVDLFSYRFERLGVVPDRDKPDKEVEHGSFENIVEFLGVLEPVNDKTIVAKVVDEEKNALRPLFHDKPIPLYGVPTPSHVEHDARGQVVKN